MTGFKDTWNLSLQLRHVAASSRCSRLILWSGAPRHPPPSPGFRSDSLRSAKGGGSWGSLAHQSSRSCRRGAPCPREPVGGFPSAARARRLSSPPPPTARPCSLPPAPWPERAHRGSGTWARGRRRPLLPLPEPKPEPEPARSPSMLRALQPPSAQPLARAQPREPREPVKQPRGDRHGQEERRGGLGRAGF